MSAKLMDKFWYKKNAWVGVLYPFALMYRGISQLRRYLLCTFYQQKFTVPVIVVGNLSLGGVGKTPLVIAIATELMRKGLRVGVVSRGYGAKIRDFPHLVLPSSKVEEVGDEPLLIAKRTQCPVVIAPQRVEAVDYLLERFDCQVIVSDDGLQHYKMGRSIEIVVIDGLRGMGNGWCLPAGPLREGIGRLKQADFLIVNGGAWPQAHTMDLIPGKLTSLLNGAAIDPSQLQYEIAAIAGIGNPTRFFNTLTSLGISFSSYAFKDHHEYAPHELQLGEKIIVMTEKDAVKCQAFANSKMYFLPVEAKISSSFWNAFWSHEQLQGYINEASSME
jgi:tetraacyldisaccharide 4'-kinase